MVFPSGEKATGLGELSNGMRFNSLKSVVFQTRSAKSPFSPSASSPELIANNDPSAENAASFTPALSISLTFAGSGLFSASHILAWEFAEYTRFPSAETASAVGSPHASVNLGGFILGRSASCLPVVRSYMVVGSSLAVKASV
jgi:hypothetical protein